MLLKRIYLRNEEGEVVDRQNPTVLGVQVLRAKDFQRFSPDLVAAGVAQGWIVVEGNTLTVKNSVPNDDGSYTVQNIVYRIVSRPGYYCCQCDAPVANAEDAKAHILAEHPDQTSPDPSNPAGYRRTHSIDCEVQ